MPVFKSLCSPKKGNLAMENKGFVDGDEVKFCLNSTESAVFSAEPVALFYFFEVMYSCSYCRSGGWLSR